MLAGWFPIKFLILLETTFTNSRWCPLSRVLQIPTIDELYCGGEIRHYHSKLSAIGGAVDAATIIEKSLKTRHYHDMVWYLCYDLR